VAGCALCVSPRERWVLKRMRDCWNMRLTAPADVQGSVASDVTASALGIGEQTLSDTAALLREQNRGVASLQGHIQRVERDVALVLGSAKGPDMLMVTSQPG
jgi:hypothetical protein